MAVNSLKSVSVTAKDALIAGSATAMDDKLLSGGILKVITETYEATTADVSSGSSTIRLFRVRSDWSIRRIGFMCDALTGGAVDIGLYQTAANGGAVVDADCYASAVVVTTAINTAQPNYAFEARDIAAIRNKVWQDAGLTADPRLPYDIALTVTTDLVPNGAAATISVQLYYCDPI